MLTGTKFLEILEEHRLADKPMTFRDLTYFIEFLEDVEQDRVEDIHEFCEKCKLRKD